jgi:hypothetical protein
VYGFYEIIFDKSILQEDKDDADSGFRTTENHKTPR